jgi:hypothetical protein
MPEEITSEWSLNEALKDNLAHNIKNRDEVVSQLAENLAPLILPTKSKEGLKAILHKPGGGAIAIAKEDFDLVVTLGSMVGLIASIMSGATVITLVDCAVIIWTYWKLAIHLTEDEAIITKTVKKLQDKKQYPSTRQIAKEIRSEGYAIKMSHLKEVLISLGKKRNKFGSECEIIELVQDGEKQRWGVIAY